MVGDLMTRVVVLRGIRGGTRHASAGTMVTGQVVTAVPPLNSIGYVLSRTAPSSPQRTAPRIRRGRSAGLASAVNLLLTKRRAVDFCRVATAMCPRPVPFAA